MREVVIVGYGRSAVGKAGKKGSLRFTRGDDIAAQVLRGVLDRTDGVSADDIEDVIFGCVSGEAEQGLNIARYTALQAGLPVTAGGQVVNRFCGSSTHAIISAANGILAGDYDIAVAGGVENMSQIPMGGLAAEKSINMEFYKKWPEAYMPMGLTAEVVAEKYHISRAEMDAFAAESYQKAELARREGKFDSEIIPVKANAEDGTTFMFSRDECVREGTTAESLSVLKPVFKEGGKVTAGNSSQNADAASIVILMERSEAERRGIKPIAAYRGMALTGCAPEIMGVAPATAVPKLLKKKGLTFEDIDLVELNEAFASQAIVCIREWGIDPGKVNVNGGAIALGHPTGATGGYLTCKVLNELKRRNGKYGIVTMCMATGEGVAVLYEML